MDADGAARGFEHEARGIGRRAGGGSVFDGELALELAGAVEGELLALGERDGDITGAGGGGDGPRTQLTMMSPLPVTSSRRAP